MLIMRNRKVFVTRHEKQFINMCLHSHIAIKTAYFTLKIGLKSPV